jgi:hypothetical protein
VLLGTRGQRLMSMQIIDEDEYTPSVFYGKRTYTLTKRRQGTNSRRSTEERWLAGYRGTVPALRHPGVLELGSWLLRGHFRLRFPKRRLKLGGRLPRPQRASIQTSTDRAKRNHPRVEKAGTVRCGAEVSCRIED